MFRFLTRALGVKRLNPWRIAEYGKVIGIDLGTTNSCVAVSEGGEIVVIENQEGARTTPSCVAFQDDGSILVGDHAKRQLVVNPRNTFYATKRLIGRKYTDPLVQADVDLCSFDIVSNPSNEDAWVRCASSGKAYSPSQIGSFILSRMKEIAELYLGEEVTDAVVTVPAYFNNSQKQATQDAGRIAGLNVQRIINEPTAAALAYGLDCDTEGGTGVGLVAVFDLGGGTFDISILEIMKDLESNSNVFEVKSTNGDTHLGGEDFDQLITNFIIDEFYEIEGIDISDDLAAIQRVKAESENVKKQLDHMESTMVTLPFITIDPEPKNLEVEVTREFFEDAAMQFVERSIEPCRLALQDAGVAAKEIDEVILVGGMTRMPLVQQAVMNFFGRKPSKQVNPDECVAIGAAIQGAILGREIEGVVLVDVTPLSLGIELVGDTFGRIIPRNSAIPTKKTQDFTTTSDNQTTIVVKVYQGEREIASMNKLLGSFVLEGVPAAPKGVPQINVTFEIDANGIIDVSAADKATGVGKNITVQSTGGLSEDEIEAMIMEAELHREEDLKHKALRDKMHEAETIISHSRQALKELDGLLTPAQVEEVESLIRDVEIAVQANDADRLLPKVTALEALQSKYSEQAYRRAAGEPQNPEDEFND